MRTKTILLLAVIMAIVTTGLAYYYLSNSVPAGSVKGAKPLTVVHTITPISPYQTITDAMVEEIQIPFSESYSSAYSKKSDVVGKVAAGAIAQGEILFSHRLLANQDEIKQLSYTVAPGKRAVSIAVNFVTSVSNLIEPRDRVNVIVTYKPVEKGDPWKTETVLQDIPVLAVGQRLLPKPSTTGAENVDQQKEYKAVTLEVTDDQSKALILASEKGSVHLSLRSKAKKQ